MIFTTLLQRALVSLAVVTTFGVLVHDTKFDQAATIALAIPFGLTLTLAQGIELKSEGHTHVERAAFEKSARTVNSVPPRGDGRKYRLAKHMHGFNMPEPHTLQLSPALA